MMALALFGFACAEAVAPTSGEPDEPGELLQAQDYDETAEALAAAAMNRERGEIRAFMDAHELIRGRGVDGIIRRALNRFSRDFLGLSYEFSVECADETGAPQDRCGDDTDRATIGLEWSGELDLGRRTFAARRTGELRLSDLTTGIAILDGTSMIELEATKVRGNGGNQRTKSFTYKATTDIDQLRYNLEEREVIDGIIEYTVVAERVVGGVVQPGRYMLQAVLTITSNSQGPTGVLVIDGVERFRVDLSTGRVSRL